MLILFAQVEETTREREERLKGWSTFLEGGNQAQQNNTTTKPADSSTDTKPTELSSTTEPEQPKETEPQPSQEQDQDVDSTDSSLAGSDEEA